MTMFSPPLPFPDPMQTVKDLGERIGGGVLFGVLVHSKRHLKHYISLSARLLITMYGRFVLSATIPQWLRTDKDLISGFHFI